MNKRLVKEYLSSLLILVAVLFVYLVLKYIFDPSDIQRLGRIINASLPSGTEILESHKSSPSFNGDGDDYFILKLSKNDLKEFSTNLGWTSLANNKPTIEFDFPEEYMHEECNLPEDLSDSLYLFKSRNDEQPHYNYDAAILDLNTACIYIHSSDM